MTLAWQLSCPGLDAAWTAGARAPINLRGGRMGNCYKRAPIFLVARHGTATQPAGMVRHDDCRGRWHQPSQWRYAVLYYAAVFLVIALVAALLGFGGIAAGAAGIAKILFYIFLVIALVSLVAGLLRR